MRACDYSVYKITYRTSYRESISDGMDSEYTGRIIEATRDYHAAAASESLALAAFWRYHKDDRLLTVTKLFNLDSLVTTA